MLYLRIPKERVGVLVGKDGQVKVEIEERTEVKIKIDSKSGDVTVRNEDASDPVMALKVGDVIRAVGRGFPPEKAFKLFNDNYYFALFDLHDYVGKNPKHVRRIKARVIGTGGKTRKHIEEMADVDISVYGSTVALIGELIALNIARTAVDMLLSGAEHSTVYRFLERKRRELKIAEVEMEGVELR